MVTIATFTKPEDAHLLRMRLEAGGVPAYVQDEFTIQMDLLWSNALGGVRVQVDDADLPAAAAILQEAAQPTHEEGESDVHCPRCGSSRVEQERFSRRAAFLSLLLLGFPLLWIRKRLRCDDCLHTWAPNRRTSSQ